jgi:phage protein U
MAGMLLQVGPIQFEIDPLNAHAIDRAAQTMFAKKDVIGRGPQYEHTGEGEDRIVIRGRVFPYKLGGLGAIALAHTIRTQGSAQPVTRGDGLYLGWFVITELSERHNHLAGDGVGQLIEVDMVIERCDKPSAQGYFSSLMGLAP